MSAGRREQDANVAKTRYRASREYRAQKSPLSQRAFLLQAAWLLAKFGTYGCMRGFLAGWKIDAGRFYLVRVDGVHEYDGDEPIFAEWLSTEIMVPVGPVVHHPHAWVLYRAGNVHYTIEHGIVTAARFERFIKPDYLLEYEAKDREMRATFEARERREARAKARRERWAGWFPWARRWLIRADADRIDVPRVW